METWNRDSLSALGCIRDADQVFEQIGRSARLLGFEQCAYGLRLPLPFTKPPTLMLNNYDRRWARRYADAGYLAVDPTVLIGRRSNFPIIWSDDLFKNVPQFWSEARSFGLNVGWAQSCFDGDGAVGLLSFSRSHEALTHAELIAKEGQLRYLVNVGHIALSAALGRTVNKPSVPLTPREVEVLQWTADGKTSSEAADILCVSTDTINFHVKNAVAKLGVANKTAAAVRAAVLGLLK
ncbi:MAG: solR [Variovorax sp.]|nr:solR [Variovorax sp.]